MAAHYHCVLQAPGEKSRFGWLVQLKTAQKGFQNDPHTFPRLWWAAVRAEGGRKGELGLCSCPSVRASTLNKGLYTSGRNIKGRVRGGLGNSGYARSSTFFFVQMSSLKQTMSVLYRFSYKRASLRMVCGVDEDHNEHWRSVLLSCWWVAR